MDKKYNPPMQNHSGRFASDAMNEPHVTLLDHFAGLAMNAFLQSPFQMQKLTGDVNENDTLLAITCYRIADAMLKARKESNHE